jgi:hypothetical protein
MSHEPKSIADHIQCLARLTGAPVSFVDQVKQLFERKGISLHDDASPYLDALDEAFRREESIRSTTLRARQSVARMQDDFQRVGKAYVEQLSQLKRLRGSLQEESRRMRGDKSAARRGPTRITIEGDHRTFVTRPETEHLPLVPGPKDLQ